MSEAYRRLQQSCEHQKCGQRLMRIPSFSSNDVGHRAIIWVDEVRFGWLRRSCSA